MRGRVPHGGRFDNPIAGHPIAGHTQDEATAKSAKTTTERERCQELGGSVFAV
jgi:hypothetical protein